MMSLDKGFSKLLLLHMEQNDMGIQSVAVIGAGTMGSGIAQVCAQTGWKTWIFDVNRSVLEKSYSSIQDYWMKGVDLQKNTIEDMNSWNSKLHQLYELDDLMESIDLVIEAVPENLELKRNIFQKLDQITDKGTILATNTSGLSISKIANSTKFPNRVIGMHFFNPVPLMSLLELVKHPKIDQHTIEFATLVGREMGKKTILVSDTPGFATSRLGVVLGNEAIRMLDEGVASAEDIDYAMRLGYNHPMGPLELSDLVGLDVRRDILNSLEAELDDQRYRPHSLLDKLVERGEIGKKVGKGIYDWTDGEKRERRDF